MCKSHRFFTVVIVTLGTWATERSTADDGPIIRVATYNTSLNRNTAGQLVRDLEGGSNEQARKIAEVIQRVRPDIVLLNEFDYDANHQSAELFRSKYLATGQNGCEPIQFGYDFTAPVNTGRPSGRDLNHNGKTGEADDAFGFGRHEGQYGMLVLSKFPIERDRVRTFQNFLWRDMPDAMQPMNLKSHKPFYSDDDLAIFRLSSKSHWDVPIEVPAIDGAAPFKLHLLCSHPTPPVFDGPEDRNGCRNHDEIRMLADYIQPDKGAYLVDDSGRRGGLDVSALFVIVGDLNCDPVDGDSVRGTMDQLLKSPRVNGSSTPASNGGPFTAKQFADQFVNNHGNPANATSNFTAEGHGCLRVDYALPSKGLEIVRGGVFWPAPGEPGADAVTATDHRAVWIDIRQSK
jgi:hypothetical protein